MRKTAQFNNTDPRHRVVLVHEVLEHPDSNITLDMWSSKLRDMYLLRDKFKSKHGKTWHLRFRESLPLYSKLLDVFEDNASGSLKHIVEAALLTGIDCKTISSDLNIPEVDPMFLSLYRELFYDVRDVLGNPVAEFRYIISPLLGKDSDKLALEAIWKLLALAGGTATLKRKGFGTEAPKAEDIMYILQLASFRNCSMILKYVNIGTEFFKDNPTAAAALSCIADFDSVRGPARRLDYFAELSAVAKNNLSALLSSGLKLINAPEDEIIKLVELDGAFNPGSGNKIETVSHVNFLDMEESESDA